MADEQKSEPTAEVKPEVKAEAPKAEAPKADAKPEQRQGQRNDQRPPREGRGGGGGGDRGPRREGDRGPRREGDRPGGGDRRGGDHRGGDHRGGPRHGGPGGGGGGDYRGGGPEIDLDKLIGDSLYLDNQAHVVVARLGSMDSGTKSQLRRFYNAVRRACRAAEGERQHEFVMLRARLAYTIARHSLRSLDQLERLLLQVTRKNDARGYERFRDLFEAIVAYNE